MKEMKMEKMPMDMSDDLAKAKRRMDRMMASPEEIMLYKCAPNAAKDNYGPGIPMEDYGELMDN